MYDRIMGAGLMGDGGLTAGADGGASGMVTVVPPPEEPGPGINTGDGDLLLMVLFRFLRRV